MARFEGQVRPIADEGPFRNPWPALIAAGALIVAAIAANAVLRDHASWVAVILTGAGVVAAGSAVALRPTSALNLLLAGGLAIIASIVGDLNQWDSARLVLRVLAGVSILASGVILLPTTFRRLVVSLIILFHFGGIVVAVTSADGAWVPVVLWTYVYRPYSQFTYLQNAYHFYAPEPGNAPLLWFRIEYDQDADGSRNVRWLKVPEISKEGEHLRPDGTRLWPNQQYTRRLSLAESLNQPQIAPPMMLFVYTTFRDQEIANARLRYETTKDPTTWPLRAIPLLRDIPYTVEQQYREPSHLGKKWLESYVRYVARSFPHQEKPHLAVKNVKVYRVTHTILSASLMQQGVPHDDEETFDPYFMGEFDRDGHMIPYNGVARLPDGSNVPLERDPLLYWRIPRMRPQHDVDQTQGKLPADYLKRKLMDFLPIHAGDAAEGVMP